MKSAMETIFFCARNFKDYLKINRANRAKIQATEIKMRDVLIDEKAQNFLYDHMKFYDDRETGCEAPVLGRTEIIGLNLDFNFGLRLEVPRGNFHVRIGDFDSGTTFLDEDLSNVRLISVEKQFIRWQVEVFYDGEEIFSHVLDLEGQPVMIVARLNGLGDVISLLPYFREFRRRHGCNLTVLLPKFIREFAANLYPDIPQADAINFKNYANYFPVMPIGDYPKVPADIRNEPMERIHGTILGLETLPPAPTFRPTAQRLFPEPYVCIGVQASTPVKGWHYPNGWKIIVDYLKRLGYRVFCIDKKKVQREGNYSTVMPENAEDFTGNFSIMERANMLYHAEFFIGLGSGLSWVANAVGCPVVMICGFSQDWFEFHTPYRVVNRLTCTGCLNDVRVDFIGKRCPYHKGTDRELECQKKISPRQVIDAINRLIEDKDLTPPIFN